MTNARLYATCPNCGRRLCKAVPGSDIETQCPQCKGTVVIQVDKDGKVTTQIVETKNAI